MAILRPGQLSLLIVMITAAVLLPAADSSPAVAASDGARWTRVNIPAGGGGGGWVLAAGSNVRHLTRAVDGTLYAYGEGLDDTLYKATDGGQHWASSGNVQDAIYGIAVSPHDGGAIYYATASDVFRSVNGGRTFTPLPGAPGGAGSGNVSITAIAAARLDGDIVAVATRDADAAEFGGVYTLDMTEAIPAWTDSGIGGYDVYAVAFSPGYAADGLLAAVATDETETFVTSRMLDGGWGAAIGPARLEKDNGGASIAAGIAAIAFPSDYDADTTSGRCEIFVAIATGTGEGDVYQISGAENNSAATDLNVGSAYGLDNTDIAALAASGSAPPVSLLAGSAASARIFCSADGGRSWSASRKDPTGDSVTGMLILPDSTAFAATTGTESALSVSRDSGQTWNQLSLIDTAISTIVSLAPSPRYRLDRTLFLLTFGGKHSLWRSLDGGSTWERTFSGALAGVDSLDTVGLPPEYGDAGTTVFIAGESGGSPAIWKSTDNGQSFRRRLTRDPDTGTAFPADVWAIADDDTIFVGSYDGSHGLVYRTTNSGFTYAAGAVAGSQPLSSLVLSPAYPQDTTLLAGNTAGGVYLSDDDGISFLPLPADAAAPLTGAIAVAFDPEFKSNRTVYAASTTAGAGIYRFTIGTDADWENIDSTLPAGATLNRLAAGERGTLYAANSHADGGMERCLNPTYASGPTFETVASGLGEGATLWGLWMSAERLWTMDTTNNRLMTFKDTLTVPAALVSPADAAGGIGSLTDHTVRNISLDWESLEGATSYEWQLDDSTDLFGNVSGNTTQASTVHLPALAPDTAYYWRVRAKTPVLSPWSEKRSFTTSLDTDTAALRLESPPAGATGISIKPTFQWAAVAGANVYELLVSAEADFSQPAIIRQGDYAIAANAWQSDLSLDYATTYYWKVRAINTSTSSQWSAVGTFTTEALPGVEEATPATITPLPGFIAQVHTTAPVPTTPLSIPLPAIVQVPGVPAWVIYVIGGLLAIAILALMIVLAIVLKIKRF